jgi:hypothetical protein
LHDEDTRSSQWGEVIQHFKGLLND